MKSKMKREIDIFKKQVKWYEYIFWWLCRIMMISVLVETASRDNGGHFNLQMWANTILLFVLPALHILPRKYFSLARLHHRAQTIASFMIIMTSYVGVYLSYYYSTWSYDIFVHFIGAVVCVPAGYYLIKAMSLKNESFSPLTASTTGFGLSCFASLGWESYEFLFDWFANDTTQRWQDIPNSPIIQRFPTDPGRYPLFDTMTDLLAGLVGAIVGGIIIRIVFEAIEKRRPAAIPIKVAEPESKTEISTTA